ncbi:MAG: hypothetical protein HY618_00080 [Candidatus Tectomicrobia bacterium]|uniref:Uncharacterized protein n=1 Tax=Tectimicrobiota bacterium TaxID=2528274 RepID=A0A932ZSR5_UNCTE|nr:hypothetical protein [Candidatus Tectomicrobia bacterium]
MAGYITEIRVTLEVFLTLGVLWWTIRIFALEASKKEGLKREEDAAQQQFEGLLASAKKLEEAAAKVRDKLIPSQLAVISQLQAQLANLEQNLETSQIQDKVRLYQEVKAFYTQDPAARYFRASDWVPQE